MTKHSKDLIRLRKELEIAEAEMEDLVEAAGVGAGDDQADAGAKTFEREHEMSLVQVFPRATLCMVCKQKEERR